MLRCLHCGEPVEDGTRIDVSYRGWRKYTGVYWGTVEITDDGFYGEEDFSTWEQDDAEEDVYDGDETESLRTVMCPHCRAEAESFEELFESVDEAEPVDVELAKGESVLTNYSFYSGSPSHGLKTPEPLAEGEYFVNTGERRKPEAGELFRSGATLYEAEQKWVDLNSTGIYPIVERRGESPAEAKLAAEVGDDQPLLGDGELDVSDKGFDRQGEYMNQEPEPLAKGEAFVRTAEYRTPEGGEYFLVKNGAYIAQIAEGHSHPSGTPRYIVERRKVGTSLKTILAEGDPQKQEEAELDAILSEVS